MGGQPEKQLGLPSEVQLAWEVMTCKALRETYDDGSQPCRFFNRHFGPHPTYDWLTEQPPARLAPGATRTLPARTNGIRFTVPALVGGCRKAPLMTIGINPNMPSWQVTAEGGSWCYPYFDDIAEYAAYYRHQTIYQEHFPLDLIKASIDPAQATTAAKPGLLKDVQRTEDGSQIVLSLQYDGDSAPTELRVPRQAVLALNAKQRFQGGDVLAGVLKMTAGQTTTVIQETVGYYQRFATILKKAQDQLVAAGKLPADVDLHAGEDVVLGDMVACASPGWTAKSGGVPDKDREGIAASCCEERGWLALQYQQTSPAVVVFSGTSAFGMFRQSFKGVSFDPPLPSDLSGPYAWLRFTLKNRVMMSVSPECSPARIVIAPHFSYAVNFIPIYAFTLSEWNAFAGKWPTQAAALQVKPSAGQVLVSLDNPAANATTMGPAWPDLQAQYIAAYDMIAAVLVDEFKRGTLSYDPDSQHLTRTAGPCRFCSNQLFSLPEGCRYGKLDAPRSEDLAANLMSAAIKMVRG